MAGLEALLRNYRRSRQNKWVQPRDNSEDRDPLEEIRLFGVLGTWMEADIVAASVRNALTQGCERVYLLDNGSSDGTVEAALAAGATLAESFSTDLYDDRLRYALMNALVAKKSLEDGAPHIWWLWLDADELSHGPGGTTVKEYLGGLDRRFRLVGTRVFNHFPSGRPANLPGFHPLDCQPLCAEFWQPTNPRCTLRHWKHPLQRFDRDRSFLMSQPGFHRADAQWEVLFEPTVGIFTHHFQYREEAVTRQRLDLMNASGAVVTRPRHSLYRHPRSGSPNRPVLRGAAMGAAARHRSLDAVYESRWDQVENLSKSKRPLGVTPRPWEELVTPADASVARWYSAEEFERARTAYAAVAVPDTTATG
jgi:hypothetical protein